MPHVSHLGFSGLEGVNLAVASTLLSKSPAELRVVLARSQQPGELLGSCFREVQGSRGGCPPQWGFAGARRWWVQGAAKVLAAARGRLWGGLWLGKGDGGILVSALLLLGGFCPHGWRKIWCFQWVLWLQV